MTSSPPPQSQTEVEVHCCSTQTVLEEVEESEGEATPHSRRSGGSTPLRRRRRTNSVQWPEAGSAFFEPPGLELVESSPRVGYGRGDTNGVYKYIRGQQISDVGDSLRLPLSAAGDRYSVVIPPQHQAHPVH